MKSGDALEILMTNPEVVVGQVEEMLDSLLQDVFHLVLEETLVEV